VIVWSTTMLIIEAMSVINARLGKIALGQLTAGETSLMVTEKVEAALEAYSIMTRSGDVDAVVKLYRNNVAANIERLNAETGATA